MNFLAILELMHCDLHQHLYYTCRELAENLPSKVTKKTSGKLLRKKMQMAVNVNARKTGQNATPHLIKRIFQHERVVHGCCACITNRSSRHPARARLLHLHALDLDLDHSIFIFQRGNFNKRKSLFSAVMTDRKPSRAEVLPCQLTHSS